MRSNGISCDVNEGYKYLTPNVIDSISKHFTKSVTKLLDEFNLHKMRSTSTPTIVLAIILTIWVHVTVGVLLNFEQYLEILHAVSSKHPEILSFKVKKDAIAKLSRTTDEFKNACLENDELLFGAHPQPVTDTDRLKMIANSLHKTIVDQFDRFKRSNGNKRIGNYQAHELLDAIRHVDPIGFLLALNYPDFQSSSFLEIIALFSNVYEQMDCPICFKRMKCGTPTNPSVVERCGHVFCKSCMAKWMDGQTSSGTLPTCPMCRIPIIGTTQKDK